MSSFSFALLLLLTSHGGVARFTLKKESYGISVRGIPWISARSIHWISVCGKSLSEDSCLEKERVIVARTCPGIGESTSGEVVDKAEVSVHASTT